MDKDKVNHERLIPYIATHPGFILANELEERQITANELALRLNKEPSYVKALLRGKEDFIDEIALKLEDILDISAPMWMVFRRIIFWIVRLSAKGTE